MEFTDLDSFFSPRWGFYPSKAKGSHGDRGEGTESSLSCLTLRLGHGSFTGKAGGNTRLLARSKPHVLVNGTVLRAMLEAADS